MSRGFSIDFVVNGEDNNFDFLIEGVVMKLITCLVGLLLVVSSLVWGDSVTKQTDDFEAIYHTIHQLIKDNGNPSQILLVLDDDATISDMKFPPTDDRDLAVDLHGLGGVGWGDWQMKLLKQCRKHRTKQCQNLVIKSRQDLFNIQAILFLSRWSDIVQPKMIEEIKQLQKQGVAVIGETARQPRAEEATQAQLHHLINDRTGDVEKLDFTVNPIQLNHPLGAQGYFNAQGLDRAPLLYKRGVMYVTGQNKGRALKSLLNHAHQHYRYIVFVDDLTANVEDVAKAYQQANNTTVISYKFTADEPFKHVDKKQAQKDWQAIRQAMGRRLSIHARYSS